MRGLRHALHRALLPTCVLLAFLAADASVASAQDAGEASADSVATEFPRTEFPGTETPGTETPGAEISGTETPVAAAVEPFIESFVNNPKIGTQTNATSNAYYGEYNNVLTMRGSLPSEHRSEIPLERLPPADQDHREPDPEFPLQQRHPVASERDHERGAGLERGPDHQPVRHREHRPGGTTSGPAWA